TLSRWTITLTADRLHHSRPVPAPSLTLLQVQPGALCLVRAPTVGEHIHVMRNPVLYKRPLELPEQRGDHPDPEHLIQFAIRDCTSNVGALRTFEFLLLQVEQPVNLRIAKVVVVRNLARAQDSIREVVQVNARRDRRAGEDLAGIILLAIEV